MKSEKLTERITVRVSENDLEAVARYAKKHRLDPSDVFRMGTMAFLSDQEILGETKAGFVKQMGALKKDVARLKECIPQYKTSPRSEKPKDS